VNLGQEKGKSDLFGDLRDQGRGTIEAKLSDLEKQNASLGTHRREREQERRKTINRAKEARTTLRNTDPSSAELGQMRKEIRLARAQLGGAKKVRDRVNALVPLPIPRLDERIQMLEDVLCRQGDNEPVSLKDEIGILSDLLRLKAERRHKEVGDRAHSEIVRLFQVIRDARSRISVLTEEIENEEALKIESSEILQKDDVSWKGVRSLNHKIDQMKGEINTMHKDGKALRREIGRLKAYLRILDRTTGKTHQYSRRNDRELDALQERMAAGKTLDFEELTKLVNAKRMPTGKSETLSPAKRSTPAPPPRRRSTGALRGRGRVGRAEGNSGRRDSDLER